MNTKYFELRDGKIPSVEILKVLWRKIAMKLHPDKGGNEAEFKSAQMEYELLLSRSGATFSAASDSPGAYSSWDDYLAGVSPTVAVCLQNLRAAGIADCLEICGRWIWVDLDSKDVARRSMLKQIVVDNIHFRFSPTKKMWYWAGAKSFSRGTHSMDYIRNQYGSRTFENSEKTEENQFINA